MDTHEALRTRRTIHSFLPDVVPEHVLARALESAHHAPCHRQGWPWRFTRIGAVARQAIADRAVEIKARGSELPEGERAAIREKFLTAPELWIASQIRSEDVARDREDYAATACAIENLMLSLHADGFGAKWSTGRITTDDRTYTVAGIDRAAEIIVGFLWIGRAKEVPTIPRPPWRSVVRSVP